ncbi:MAG: 4Fe-4S dicluster domain-containing protein [Chloroflexi bacterium]|nr:4Fe-4S dicluster domain-containing protein [Chloroflexota bacterium]
MIETGRTNERTFTRDELFPELAKLNGKRRASFWSRKTAVPTYAYDIVGPLKRYDGRDAVLARGALRPGTEAYRAYYERHPELEEADRKLRSLIAPEEKRKQRESRFGEQPLALALSSASPLNPHVSRGIYGRISEHKVAMDPETAARNIKGVARYLGADLVGICRLNPLWVYSYDRDGNPVDLNHTYAICMAFAYRDFDMLLAQRGTSPAAMIECNHWQFSIAVTVGLRLASYIRNLGYDARDQVGGQVQNIPLAIDAGLGELGRCGLLNTKKFGPAVRLDIVTTDLPLAVDSPVDIGVQDLCAKCKKCSEVCPVGAMSTKDEKDVVRGVKVWPIDSEKCLKFRMAFGDIEHCNYCVAACCWTKPLNWFHRLWGELAARSSLGRTFLAWVDDVFYGHRPRQHRLPGWLNYDRTRPTLKERVSRSLHHI